MLQIWSSFPKGKSKPSRNENEANKRNAYFARLVEKGIVVYYFANPLQSIERKNWTRRKLQKKRKKTSMFESVFGVLTSGFERIFLLFCLKSFLHTHFIQSPILLQLQFLCFCTYLKIEKINRKYNSSWIQLWIIWWFISPSYFGDIAKIMDYTRDCWSIFSFILP